MAYDGSRTSSRVVTRVVYDRETGEIFHMHQALAGPGVKLPNETDLTAAALHLARQVTGRSVGELDVLSVPEADLNPGTTYKVDVQGRRLIAATKKSSV